MNQVNTLIDFIVRSYNKRNLWILVGGICFCMAGFLITGTYIGVGQPIADTGQQIQLLDVLFNYSQEDAYVQLAAYGEEGRRVYLFSALVIDSIFPLIYGSFWALLLAFLLGKTSYRMLILLPLVVILADYLENTHTALLLINFPEKQPLIAYWGSIFTSVKWGLIGLVFMAISFGFFLKNRKNFLLEIDKRGDFI